jgi:hypothetical protein
VDIQVISRRLGHSSVAITLRLYGHVTPKLHRTAARAISALIDGPRQAIRAQSVHNEGSGAASEAGS